jgi:hypothetical protein
MLQIIKYNKAKEVFFWQVYHLSPNKSLAILKLTISGNISLIDF